MRSSCEFLLAFKNLPNNLPYTSEILFRGHDFDSENANSKPPVTWTGHLGRCFLHPIRGGQWRNRPMAGKVFMRNAQLRGKVIYRGQPKV
jgi:hypothetical protein